MQLGLPFPVLQVAPPEAAGSSLQGPSIDFVRMRRAKRYIIRVLPDGSLRVTIPRGGSRREAESFLDAHRRWAHEECLRVLAQHAPAEWAVGDRILLNGAPVTLRLERAANTQWLIVGDERVRLRSIPHDLRPAVEACLRQRARRDLVPRLRELAGARGLTVSRITIRNQRSRWGSCSRAGVIALNFRLVQVPGHVRDYVLIHELMHLKQPNHSRRFWRLVEAACPDFRAAERWLRTEGRSLF